MPFSLLCYNGHPLTVGDEYAGRKVICPVCQLTVPVPNPAHAALPQLRNSPTGDGNDKARPPMAVADEEEETPRTLGPAAGQIGAGLTFHSARLVLYLLSIFALIVVLILAVALIVDEEVLEWTTAAVGLTFFFLQPALGVVGSAMCLGTPSESKSRRFILASLVLDLTTAAVGVLLILTEQSSMYVVALPIFSWMLLMLFLRSTALYLDQPDYAHDALVLMLCGAGLALLGGLLRLGWIFYWNEVRPELLPDARLVLDVVLYLVCITWLVFLIRLILSNLEFIGTIRRLIRPTP